MRIALAHCRDQTLQHLRAPGYLVPILAMPGLFYFLFEGQDTEVGLVTRLMASLGGLWALPAELPSWTREISPYLPTRLWGR